jgi:hypothetical protein
LAAAALVWFRFGQPAGLGGLAGTELAALVVYPLAALAVLFGVPHLALSAIPDAWRKAYRDRHGRRGIPKRIRAAVLAMDRHRCLFCGEPGGLQIDHIRPWSCGGLDSLFNFVALCGPCNRVKSNYWVYPSGMVVYRAWEGSEDALTAAEILFVERRALRSPARWLRAAWHLAA